MAREEFVITARDATKEAFNSVERGLGKISSALKPLQVALLGAAGVAGLGLMVKRSYDTADALGDMAENLRMSTNALSKFQYASSFYGLSQEQSIKLLEKQNLALDEAIKKAGPARDALTKLGLSARDLAQMSPDKAFAKISDELRNVGNAAQQAGLATDIFGDKLGVKAVGLILGGSAALSQAANQAERIGVALSNVDNARLEQTNDSLQRVGSVFAGIGNRIAIGLAPYLKYIADWFVNSASDAEGWKDGINSGLETVARAVAFLGDVFHGLKVVWKILEVAFQATVAAVMGGLASLDRGISKVIDAVPGLEATPNKALQEWANATNAVLGETESQLFELMNQPMPSAGIEEFFAKIREESAKSAAQLASDRERGNQISEPVGNSFRNNFDADFLEKIAQRGKSEQELLLAQYQQKQIDLENYYVATDMLDSDYQQRKIALNQDFQKKLTEIQERGTNARSLMWRKAWNGDLTSVAGVMGEVSNLMQSSSKKQFEIGKKAAIAQAIVNTYQAAASGFATTPFFPLGLAMGALAIANGINTVNKIKAQQFGGGGGAIGTYSANPNTGIPTQSQPGLPPQQQDRQQSNSVQVIIQGNVLGNEEFVTGTLIPAIADAINNGDQVIIGSSSRQAREIVNA